MENNSSPAPFNPSVAELEPQSDTLSMLEEVHMLPVVADAVPLRDAPVVASELRSKQVLNSAQWPVVEFCEDMQSLVPVSAWSSFSPIGGIVAKALGRNDQQFPLEVLARYKATLIQAPVHGRAEIVNGPSHHWTYVPQDGYKGPDRAVFVVEADGKRVKAVVNFLVLPVINEPKEDDEVKERTPECKSFDFRVLDKSSGT